MRKPPKRLSIKDDSGRKYLPRDNTKLLIIKYLLSKDTDTTASLYEILHHSGIAMYDYPYLKKILQEMAHEYHDERSFDKAIALSNAVQILLDKLTDKVELPA